MDYGSFWGDGAAYPHGLRTRFGILRLDRVFGTFDAFIEAAQWQQFRNLQYQIRLIRARPGIVGYVITELTDVHWEANGLMDLRRNPRVFHDRFAEVNADVVIVPQPRRSALWSGEVASVDVVVASGGRGIGDGAVLAWTLGDQSGRVVIPAVQTSSASRAIRIEVAMPALERPTMVALGLSIAEPGEPTLAATTLDLALFTRRPPARGLAVAASEPELGAYLAALGYEVVDPDSADVVVGRGVDAGDVDAIRRGRRMLVLADRNAGRGNLRIDEAPREQPFLCVVDGRPGLPAPDHHHFPGLGVSDRHGTIWRGDWISSFGWLRRHGPFAALPGGPLLDLSFDRVVPNAVLTGFQPWEYESRVHAGVVVGWVHKPAATIGERPFGLGKLLATTFRLTRDRPGADPVAATLLHALISCATA